MDAASTKETAPLTTSTPKTTVSVVIPAFNSAAYLREAIESVFRQTVKPLEVIVIDDGSEDRTFEAAAEFGNRITYLRKERGGPATARNIGIRAALGEWIAFLDADDIWMPNLLEKLLQCAAGTRADLAFCDSMTLVDGRIVGAHRLENCRIKSRLDRLAPNGILRNPFELLLEVGCYIFPSSTLVRRECLLQVGLFDEVMYGTEDIDLWLRLSLKYRFAVLNDPLVLRRMHTTNISRDVWTRVTNEIKVYEKLGRYGPTVVSNRRRRRLLCDKKASLFREQGALFLERGDILSARKTWAKSVRSSFTARIAAYWLATFLPQSCVVRLRNWKAHMRSQVLRPDFRR
jgi:glycosyltransferase involved in cell wall biosynthesis